MNTSHANFFPRLRSLLLSPRAAWEPIAAETPGVGELYRTWILWLAAVTPLATFIGRLVFGVPLTLGIVYHPPIGSLVAQLVAGYALALLLVFVWGLAAAELAPGFGGRPDRQHAAGLKLVAYAIAPIWLVGVFNLLPSLGVLLVLLTLAALVYTVWQLYLGAPLVLGVPRERATAYVAVLVVIGVVLGLLVGVVLAAIGSPGTY